MHHHLLHCGKVSLGWSHPNEPRQLVIAACNHMSWSGIMSHDCVQTQKPHTHLTTCMPKALVPDSAFILQLPRTTWLSGSVLNSRSSSACSLRSRSQHLAITCRRGAWRELRHKNSSRDNCSDNNKAGRLHGGCHPWTHTDVLLLLPLPCPCAWVCRRVVRLAPLTLSLTPSFACSSDQRPLPAAI